MCKPGQIATSCAEMTSVHPCLALSCIGTWRKPADATTGLRHSARQESRTGRVAAAQSAPDEARRLASALSSRRVGRRGGSPATTRSSISPSERRFARACSCCRRPSRRTCWLWKIGRWNHTQWGCGCCSARRCQKSTCDRYSAAVTLPVKLCSRRQYTTGLQLAVAARCPLISRGHLRFDPWRAARERIARQRTARSTGRTAAAEWPSTTPCIR